MNLNKAFFFTTRIIFTILCTFPFYGQCQDLEFTAASHYEMGYKPNSLAGGYLDDNKFFLAVTTSDTNKIVVMHGNEAGELSGPSLLPCDYRGPFDIAVADLNRNGKSDLVVTVDPVILSYLGDGEGNFTITGGAFNGFSAMTMPTLGDFTNDGILDLAGVFISFRDVVSVMIGTSSGSFSRFGNYQSTSSAHARANSSTVGDINKDGYLELIVAHDNPGHVSVLWGDGTAKFFTRSSFDLNTSSNSVAVADLNKDGNPDIVVAGKNYNNISVLLGDGNGDFSEPVYFSAGTSPVSMVVIDLNKDGNYDVAVANQDSDSVTVLVGDGTGNFSNTTRFATGKTPIKIIALDFNRDRLVDLATANQGSSDISVFLNTTISSINRTFTTSPKSTILYQNYPNPFNPVTTIRYKLTISSEVFLHIYNSLGQKITTLVNEQQPAGYYNITWDAGNLACGVYFYKIEAGSFMQIKKMLLIK